MLQDNNLDLVRTSSFAGLKTGNEFRKSITVTLKSGIVEGIREAKSGSGWLESSSVEFVAKFLANSLALSEEEEITSGPLMIGGIGDFPRLRTLLVILQNSLDRRR